MSDLLQVQILSSSQITRDLNGTLQYNHEEWVAAQSVRVKGGRLLLLGGVGGRTECESEGREVVVVGWGGWPHRV